MSGNSFGELFRVTTFGESHGAALGAVVDGCPPGLPLSEADIQQQLDRRRPGQSRWTTQRRESDKVEILSGLYEGRTTGTPIGLLIRNEDARSRDYAAIADRFRPGHADYTYHHKYGIRDPRGGGRASARETAMRVAAGAIARKFLHRHYAVEIRARVYQVGELAVPLVDWAAVDQNPFFVADSASVPKLEALLADILKQGDSLGAGVHAQAIGLPVGWGEPVFDKLDAEIGKAMLSINAAKGVEIGSGFGSIGQKGSEHRDPLTPEGFTSNHAGGVLGGISSGQPLEVRVAFKPTSSIRLPVASLTVEGEPCEIKVTGRHDPCVGLRAVPIVEAMLALVLMEHALRQAAMAAAPPE